MIRHLPLIPLFPPWRCFRTCSSDCEPVPPHTEVLYCTVGAVILRVWVCVWTHWASEELWDGDATESTAPSPLSLSALYSQHEVFIHCSARVIIVTVSQHGLPHTQTHTYADRLHCVNILSYKNVNRADIMFYNVQRSVLIRKTAIEDIQLTVAAA